MGAGAFFSAIPRVIIGILRGILNFFKNIIRKREDGRWVFFNLAYDEWARTLAFFIIFYLAIAGFFIAMLSISTAIRAKGVTYMRPGSILYCDPLSEDYLGAEVCPKIANVKTGA
uniref:Uncharacterized protein n=1 Tax=Compsopogon caeruleus TaxID=31354 RepID=A0A6T6CMF2_9RHOD|mmetsp:Transcript_8753/g.17734  ORF Transcript_8753/g.17734 Transcript_8753/m.17734 type:complete len:115 (+) Transcript_8753:266-610(+)|eukprot:CAMPEP_0184678744 /NCGR_PEP_ID=MMETSP0312-20130426/1539_1 /TAXON_ID=31354 /ORGANISM="Compsopogon coeruleus, Strain SAG 36.94" /LENGTH=114 /DNA_ID=CAMNT_0027127721 /DNA_START=244 /DNA_END=588 /DNA_ORIENTATION=+